MPGGLLNIIRNKHTAIIDFNKITTRRLGNWIAVPVKCNDKRLEIISLCRTPELSKSDRHCSSLSQHNLINAKARSTSECRKEIFDDIKKHVTNNGDTNNIIIVADCNQNTREKEVKRFHNDIGAKEIYP